MKEELAINIKRLGKEEVSQFIALIGLFESVLEMIAFSIPSTNHHKRLLSRDDFIVFVAELDGQIVGGLTTYVIEQYYSEKPLAYVYDLAVDDTLQRQGIGKKLIAETNKFYKERGFEEVYVEAEKADRQAVNFYRKTLPSGEEDVAYFHYKLN